MYLFPNIPQGCWIIYLIMVFWRGFDIEKNPTHSIRPLLRDVDPSGKIGPIKIDVKCFHESVHDIDDVHQSSHTFDIDITCVVISGHYLGDVCSILKSPTTSVIFTPNAGNAPNTSFSMSACSTFGWKIIAFASRRRSSGIVSIVFDPGGHFVPLTVSRCLLSSGYFSKTRILQIEWKVNDVSKICHSTNTGVSKSLQSLDIKYICICVDFSHIENQNEIDITYNIPDVCLFQRPWIRHVDRLLIKWWKGCLRRRTTYEQRPTLTKLLIVHSCPGHQLQPQVSFAYLEK